MLSWRRSNSQITASHYELAKIAQQVYRKSGGFVSGWDCNGVHEIKGIGIAVYKHRYSNTMVIAFRGTDLNNLYNLIFNMWTNLKIALGFSPSETVVACNKIQEIRADRTFMTKLSEYIKNGKDNQLILVGHSMGGCLAQYAGFEYLQQGKNYQVVSFESPGLVITAAEKSQYGRRLQKVFLTYLTDPNFVNTCATQVGKIYHVNSRSYKPTLYHKYLYYGKHISSSVVYDTARLMLFANMARMLLHFFVDDSFFLSRFLSLPQAAFMYILSFVGLDELFEASPSPSAFITLFAVLPLLIKVVLPLIQNYFTNVLQQHSIDNFVRAMENKTERPKRAKEMKSWPKSSEYSYACLSHGFNMFIPFSENVPSLRTIVDPEAMEQRQTKSISGYKPK